MLPLGSRNTLPSGEIRQSLDEGRVSRHAANKTVSSTWSPLMKRLLILLILLVTPALAQGPAELIANPGQYSSVQVKVDTIESGHKFTMLDLAFSLSADAKPFGRRATHCWVEVDAPPGSKFLSSGYKANKASSDIVVEYARPRVSFFSRNFRSAILDGSASDSELISTRLPLREVQKAGETWAIVASEGAKGGCRLR